MVKIKQLSTSRLVGQKSAVVQEIPEAQETKLKQSTLYYVIYLFL